MKDFAEAIRYLYEQFLLRDVLSYVTPGSFVIASCVVFAVPSVDVADTLKQLPVLVFIPLFGLAFAVGFGIEQFGVAVRMLKWHNDPDDQTHLSDLRRFHQRAKERQEESQWLERTRERIAVKKTMSGANLMAIIIFAAMAFGSLAQYLEYASVKLIPTLILAGPVILGLFRAHKHQRELLRVWEGLLVHEKNKADESR